VEKEGAEPPPPGGYGAEAIAKESKKQRRMLSETARQMKKIQVGIVTAATCHAPSTARTSEQ